MTRFEFNNIYKLIAGHRISERILSRISDEFFDSMDGTKETLKEHFSLRPYILMDYMNNKEQSEEDHALMHILYGVLSPMMKQMVLKARYGNQK